jgi:hypothetical protein
MNQAGTIDTYTFTFKITNDIPRKGFILLSFPNPPWTNGAPQEILSLTKSIKVMGFTKTGFTVDNPITGDVTYSGLFDLIGVTASNTQSI